jgi:hypothetical protein
LEKRSSWLPDSLDPDESDMGAYRQSGSDGLEKQPIDLCHNTNICATVH